MTKKKKKTKSQKRRRPIKTVKTPEKPKQPMPKWVKPAAKAGAIVLTSAALVASPVGKPVRKWVGKQHIKRGSIERVIKDYGTVVHSYKVPKPNKNTRNLYIVGFEHPRIGSEVVTRDSIIRSQVDLHFMLDRFNARGVPTIIGEASTPAPHGEEIGGAFNQETVNSQAMANVRRNLRHAGEIGDYDAVLKQYRALPPELAGHIVRESIYPEDFHTTSFDERVELKEADRREMRARRLIEPYFLKGRDIPPEIMAEAKKLLEDSHHINHLRSLNALNRLLELPPELQERGTVKNSDAIGVMGAAHLPLMRERVEGENLHVKNNVNIHFIVPRSMGFNVDWNSDHSEVYEFEAEVRGKSSGRVLEKYRMPVPLRAPTEADFTRLRHELEQKRK